MDVLSSFNRKQRTLDLEKCGSLAKSAHLRKSISVDTNPDEGILNVDEHLGKVNFALLHDVRHSELIVEIKQATDLPAMDHSGFSDPYCVVSLLDVNGSKEPKHKTSVVSKNLNPQWDESFTFPDVTPELLKDLSLYINVYDYDRFSRDDPIGEIIISLNVDKIDTGITLWRYLQPCKSQLVENIVEEHLGSIEFGIRYDESDKNLILNICQAKNLAAMDPTGASDPYVKIFLLPDKKEKLNTKVKFKTLNPRWDEKFAFKGLNKNKLHGRTLLMTVVDYDRFSRDDEIGEVYLPLSGLDLTSELIMWKDLQPCHGHSDNLGEIDLSLSYHALMSRLTVVVFKCRQLKAADANGFSDPYVKIWMMHGVKRLEKKETAIKYKNLNPVYNESFIFNCTKDKIHQTSLVVTVMDHDKMGRNDPLGQIILGKHSGPQEMKHWNDMLNKSGETITQWHILRNAE